MSTIREDFFTAKAKSSLWDVAVSIKRGNPLPLDADSIFESYAALEAYAADVLAYPGQVVAVVNEDSTGIYYLDQNLAIKPVGVIPAGDDMSVDMDDNDVISLHNFGKVFYKYVAEDGDVAAHYEKVDVSDENPWVAGLEPRVVTENGKLVLGWYEPNPTTIDGVNDQVTAVQGTVTDLADSLGAPSTENSEATGLYKEVEDVQEEVEELIDVIGSADDSLNENVQTIWAHVNNTVERIVELEKFDHGAYALNADLEAEAARAAAAEKANADAIKAIADDYLKNEDKYDDTAVVGRIAAIEADYLKAEHIANMATVADVEAEAAAREAADAAEVIARDAAIAVETAAREAALAAEVEAREAADQTLQNQINLIMDNPDTENVVNSINEFITYIEEHGEIAEGFRTDIDKNKDDIAAEADRAGKAEAALGGRIDVLEAIDHDAYIAADTALENKLNAAIKLKADATALEEAVEDLEGAIADLDTKLTATDEAMGGRITALEDKFGEGEGTVEEMIAVAKQAAIDAAALDAAAKDVVVLAEAQKYADDLDAAMTARVDAVEAEAAKHALAADLTALADRVEAAEGEIDVLQDEMDAVEALAAANKAAHEANANAIEELTEVVGGIVSVGGEANVITKIKKNGVVLDIVDKAVDIEVPTKFSDLTDDSGFDGRITAAKEQADKGVKDAADAMGKAEQNAADIIAHSNRLTTVETLINGDEQANGLLKDVAALKAHDNTHAAEFSALSDTVTAHGNTIADWTSTKANTADLNAAVSRIAKNETDIATANAEIAKKADASALNSYYTNSEVDAITGEVPADKTLVQMIAEAQTAATYNDTEVRGLIAAEVERAAAAEKANADEIARVNDVLVAALDNDKEGLDSIKELATWISEHGKEATGMAEAIEANAIAISAINDEKTGILVTANAYADALVAQIPVADGDTIAVNEANKFHVAKVSTDVLVQGENVLILNGGSASV